MIGNQSELRIKVGNIYVKVGSMTSIGDLQRSRESIDTTTYDSTATEKELTLEDNGDIDLTFNYKPKEAEQKLFEAKFTENAILDFEFHIPDSLGTCKRFKGGIMQFSTTVPNKENITISATISVSGGYTTITSGVGKAKFTNSTTTAIVLKPHTKFTKTISGIIYSYRIVTQVTVPANGNVDADIFGMNGGTPSNIANNTTLTSPTTGVTCKTVGALTGGTNG